MKHEKFDTRIGAIRLPEAEEIIGAEETPSFGPVGLTPDPEGPFPLPEPFPFPFPFPSRPEFPDFPAPIPFPPGLKFCRVNLKEGCYSFSFRPNGTGFFGPFFRGTMRIEKVGGGYRISADQYRIPQRFTIPIEPVRPPFQRFGFTSDEAEDTGGVIPVHPRRRYFAYFKGTGASLFSLTTHGQKCRFTLSFDEFRYNQPLSGFNGSFPNSPDRSVQFRLNETTTPHFYSGRVFEGGTDIGSISIRWITPHLREATLEMHTLTGAEAPPAVGTEDFKTIFETAKWKLNVIDSGTVSLPAALSGVQDPNTCWSQANSATLMESVPGYDPAQLDSIWKARLLAIPAQIGCSRGRMFDNGAGDPNAVPREGAVTHSHDGYPATDSPNFGTAEGDQQKDVPRAFLRSAAHEVGHTFNQIHQFFESGSDNSIMTVTPSVANVLDSVGQSFPNDIDLAFNDTVARHLKHLPDPAVRPGGMAFFGSAVSAPEADTVTELDELEMTVTPHAYKIRMGEPLGLKWALANTAGAGMPVPEHIDVESLTLRINVEAPDGTRCFMRPPNLTVCGSNHLTDLAPKKNKSGEVDVFWGRDGFAFAKPGRHRVEVIAMWDVHGAPVMVCGSCEVWVSYPVTEKDNEIAALLMDEHVGMAVAMKSRKANAEAERRIKEAEKTQKTHPACKRMAKVAK